MADKDADDPKQIAQKRRARLRNMAVGLGLLSVAVPGTWYVTDEVIMAEGHFRDAVTAGDEAATRKYIGSLETSDLNEYYRLAITRGDETLFNLILAHDQRIERWEHDRAIYRNADALLELAAHTGHTAFVRLIDDNSLTHVHKPTVFKNLVVAGHVEAAVRYHAEARVDDFYIIDALSAAVDNGQIDAAINIADALKNNLRGSLYRYQLFELAVRLVGDGEFAHAVRLGEIANAREETVKAGMMLLAGRGDTQGLMNAAYDFGLATQDSMVDVLAQALRRGHTETADAFAQAFDVDTARAHAQAYGQAAEDGDVTALAYLDGRGSIDLQEYGRLLLQSANGEKMDVTLYLLNRMERVRGDVIYPDEVPTVAVWLFTSGALDIENHTVFAFELAKRLDFPAADRERIANLFTGTMDDALRVRWGLRDRGDAETAPRAPAP